MKYKIEFDLEEILEFNFSKKQKFELVKKVMTNNSDDKEYNKTISHFLRDLLAAELEFDNRIDVIDAYKTILKTLL